MLELDKTYSSARILLFAAQHSESVLPSNKYGSSYSGCIVRQLTIETVGSKYRAGTIYTLRRVRKGWTVKKIEEVRKEKYLQAEAERELTCAMRGVYTGLMRYNEYIKNQKAE